MLKTMSNDECIKRFPFIYYRTDLCTHHEDMLFCSEIAGSSLTKNGRIIGVLSRPTHCGNKLPGVFMRMSEYHKWIETNAGL